METNAHQQLKHLAVRYLRARGCAAAAIEVRCPIARYRVDVAGWLDRPLPPEGPADGWETGPRGGRKRRPVDPRTVVIECKQSRADFLRDRGDAARLLDERAELEKLAASIEQKRLKVHEPHLRHSGGALFPEMEDWDFAASRLPGYRRLLRRLHELDRRLYGETKFFTIARYRLADRLYLAAPRGLIAEAELPAGWGLLETPRRGLRGGPGELRVTVEAPIRYAPQKFRVRMLRNIAVSASRSTLVEADEAQRRQALA